MQPTPRTSLLAQLPTTNELAESAITASTPLLELLYSDCHAVAGINQARVSVSATTCVPGIHSCVNRVLKKSIQAVGIECVALLPTRKPSARKRVLPVETEHQKHENYQTMIKYHAAVTSRLIEMNKRWELGIETIDLEMKKRCADVKDICERSAAHLLRNQ